MSGGKRLSFKIKNKQKKCAFSFEMKVEGEEERVFSFATDSAEGRILK